MIAVTITRAAHKALKELSPEMALRIEKAFAVKMETLLELQTWHDAHSMRQRAGEIDVKPYKSSPAPEPK